MASSPLGVKFLIISELFFLGDLFLLFFAEDASLATISNVSWFLVQVAKFSKLCPATSYALMVCKG
jgi:hypothetical protein